MPQQPKNAKNAMLNAFEYFISKKPVSKITVKDIADYCCVNRMTFYYHFKDIYDLVDQIIEEKSKNCGYRMDKAETWHENYFAYSRQCLRKRSFLSTYIVPSAENILKRSFWSISMKFPSIL